ncbi:uncharacterized protein LOC126967883 [Leptidea sinapis]|uniref:Uncharacterized protein n=1 Tax=Leptidea sinapis TaxID=189913 RepID=A0A5E4R550_9NEOP|nr:uncharacterized protein LOC126967883 [Leptidea sinapis]VVD05032.1 unnamed protein product [Leptidea sinapis]
MTVIIAFCLFSFAVANPSGQIEYTDKVKTYQLDVPGKDPITIIDTDDTSRNWEEIKSNKDTEMKNLMTHIVHDIGGNRPRCYGPSCREDFVENEGPQDFDEYNIEHLEKLKDFGDLSNERLQAIADLAARLKKQKVKIDRFPSVSNEDTENDDNGKVFTSWNRLKVKQHKHPFDDKDGWVTLEPIAWSSSKISKWKPNVKKQKPSYWNEDEDTKYSNDDKYNSYSDMDNAYNYPTQNTQKKPILSRPGFINNKLHVPPEYESELPSKPTWTKNKPQQSMSMQSLQSSWSSDDSRRPYNSKPNCDRDENYPNDESIYYGVSDSVITDSRPSNFPYEYEALHQSSMQRRPMRRPTQVIYADESDDERYSKPPQGDGQWVLLSTTKGYRNKKRQRSLDMHAESAVPSVTSHHAVSLTVLPMETPHINMTTSHGGLLEVEKSFQTVEESKRDMDKKQDLETGESQNKPVKKKVIKKKIISNNLPDKSTVLAAVGAGMVPATMAMVVPMMLGKRRRRRDVNNFDDYSYQILNLTQ